MADFAFRIGGVALGLGVGLGWGWVSGRVFRRALAQDLSAMLIAWLLGSVVAVAAALAKLVYASSSSSGGLGAVSAGASEVLLYGLLPGAILLVVAAQLVRRRISRVAVVPVVLGGLAGLLAALCVATTMSLSGS